MQKCPKVLSSPLGLKTKKLHRSTGWINKLSYVNKIITLHSSLQNNKLSLLKTIYLKLGSNHKHNCLYRKINDSTVCWRLVRTKRWKEVFVFYHNAVKSIILTFIKDNRKNKVSNRTQPHFRHKPGAAVRWKVCLPVS